MAAFRGVRIGQARQVEQNEGQLEGVPGAVLFNIQVFQGLAFFPADRFGMQRVNALQRHGAVGKAEGFGGLRAAGQKCNACLNAF